MRNMQDIINQYSLKLPKEQRLHLLIGLSSLDDGVSLSYVYT